MPLTNDAIAALGVPLTRDPADRRRVEIRQPDGSWLPTHFPLLEVNDVMRLFEPTGEPVEAGQAYLVRERAFPTSGKLEDLTNPNANWGVVADPISDTTGP